MTEIGQVVFSTASLISVIYLVLVSIVEILTKKHTLKTMFTVIAVEIIGIFVINAWWEIIR